MIRRDVRNKPKLTVSVKGHTCWNCSSKSVSARPNARSKGVKVTCKKCGHGTVFSQFKLGREIASGCYEGLQAGKIVQF